MGGACGAQGGVWAGFYREGGRRVPGAQQSRAGARVWKGCSGHSAENGRRRGGGAPSAPVAVAEA